MRVGGPVKVADPYVVGEAGPERFIPRKSGGLRVAVGILTWNPLTNKRKKLLQRCVESLSAADEVTVFDNGSSDVYDLDAHVVKFPKLAGFPHGNTCGYGMNKIAATLDADIIVLSNDDVIWHPDAIPALKAVWKEAPDDVKIISGLLEPTFALPDTEPWNLPYDTVELAGHKLLSRKSVPGGAWTFRSEDKPLIFPVSTFPGVDDVPACHQLVAEGFRVLAGDWVSHEGDSTWGNQSYEKLIHTPLEDVRAEFGL